jgi:predicted cobalt transporter CbtA
MTSDNQEETTTQNETTVLRVEALREAAKIISGERNKQYGNPEDNFERTAKIWSVILGTRITNEDVAMMMVGLKVARYASKSGFQPDTWIDIAGYAACGYEVGSLESKKD